MLLCAALTCARTMSCDVSGGAKGRWQRQVAGFTAAVFGHSVLFSCGIYRVWTIIIFSVSFELCGVNQWIGNLDGCGNGLRSYPILS